MTYNLVADVITTKACATSIRSAEVELLILCCAHTDIDATNAIQMRTLLQEDLNWAYLIQTAARHKVTPLLYKTLKNTYPEAVPKRILNQLRDHFHSTALYNLLLTKELLKLLALFKDNNIAALSFKGPVLATTVYGHVALRQFYDIDVLVHKHNILKARDLLIAQGYQLCGGEDTDISHQLQHSHAWPMIHPETRVSIDLHWNLIPTYFDSKTDFSAEMQWESLDSTLLLDTMIPNLNPEDLLLILCLHGSGETWASLGRCCDVAQVIRTYQNINWALVLEKARKLHKERHLFVGLAIASHLLGVKIPDFLQPTIQSDSCVKWFQSRIRESLFLSDGSSEIFNSRLFTFMMKSYGWERVQYFFNQMKPNEKDIAVLPLPALLYPLYWLIRPIRLIRAYKVNLRQIATLFTKFVIF